MYFNDASFYTKLNSDPTLSHQKTVKTTINHFIQAGDLPASASNLFTTTPRTPVIYFLPKIHKPGNPVTLTCLLVMLNNKFSNNTQDPFLNFLADTLMTA